MKRLVIEHLPGFLKPLWARLEASPLGYRLARGTFWSLVGAVISKGLALAASIVVARVIGKISFGELGMIQSTVGLFGVFAGLGMGLTANKHVAEFRGPAPVRAGRIIALSSAMAWCSGLLMTIVLIGLAPWLAERTLAAPHLAPLLRSASLLLLFSAVNGAQTGALAGFEAFKRIAGINFYAGLASFPLLVGGVWWRGLEGAVWGLVASQALTSFLSFLAVRSEARSAGVPLAYSGAIQEWGVLWRFSLPAVLGTVTTGPVYWLCNTLLVNRPDGYAEMGVLNAANQWFTALLFLPTVLGQAALPMLAERLGQNDRGRSSRVMWLSIKVNALISLPIVVVGSVCSRVIMNLYGSSFGEAWLTLVLVLCTAGLLAMQTPVGHVITASGRMWLGALMNLGWGLGFLGFTWLFLSWGALGLATARLLAYLLHGIWTFAFAVRVLRGDARLGSLQGIGPGPTPDEPTRP
ncbi:MAG TPA: oligosaccharide flippase family protein [Candidatus Paceibacterota bacterium]|nr:oligosaccharide flippase family protein [Candidatus Paceibacterota bacterium]